MTDSLSTCTRILSNGNQCSKTSDRRYQNGYRSVHAGPLCQQHYQGLHKSRAKRCKLGGCRKETKGTLGYCRPHEHVPIDNLTLDERYELWAFVASWVTPDWETGCWIYDGVTVDEYSRLQVGSVKRGLGKWLGHRLTYHLVYKGHGQNQQLDHLCNRTLCINPLHVHPTTGGDNSKLRVRRAKDPEAPWYMHASFRRPTFALAFFADRYSLPMRPWLDAETGGGQGIDLAVYEPKPRSKGS